MSVIKVENLGKKYLIRHQQRERYTALRDVMANNVKRLGRKIFSPFTIHHSPSSNPPFTIHHSPFTASEEEFWALKDVSFEINQGERVGIIGRNGAGKTTLLKLLSRITEPTTGRITLKGRVASLLEVGTGFHPELTGRENIFLNGAILGMSKAEIKKKFDEIVDFAEIEKFLDTPVKRYSSGMYVRLAFAVAAHLEPEILLVDEVLAVGDAQFQKKCLGKMEDVGKEGRTILFVSHNMAAIITLCEYSVLLNSGFVEAIGLTSSVVSKYTVGEQQTENTFLPERGRRTGDGRAYIKKVKVSPKPLRTAEPVKFEFTIDRPRDGRDIQVELAIAVKTEAGMPLFQIYSQHMGRTFFLRQGKTIINAKVDNFYLAPGNYWVNVWMGAGDAPVDWIQNAMLLRVEPGFLAAGQCADSRGYPIIVPSSWDQIDIRTDFLE